MFPEWLSMLGDGESLLITMALLSGDASRQAVEPELDREDLEPDVGVTCVEG
jgi:hypothetical protein